MTIGVAEAIFEEIPVGSFNIPEADAAKARLLVCGHLGDASAAKEVLLALGLLDQPAVQASKPAAPPAKAQLIVQLLVQPAAEIDGFGDLGAMHEWMLEHGYLRAVSP